MKPNCRLLTQFTSTLLAALALVSLPTRAAQLINFPLNEGTGNTITDTASGLTGYFGAQNPVNDYVQLLATSPSGNPGDGCITNSGTGFLLVDDATNPILNITNGPITLESWLYIDPFTPAKSAEGIISYGNSYKLGMKGGRQVFTLYGIRDVTNSVAGFVPIGQWVHLAAAWEPGVGVHFYVNGVHYFEAFTATAARPISHNYLSLASEGFGNNSVAAFDRMRVHNALLTQEQIDSVVATPKDALPGTLVSYQFNEASLPANSAIAPSRPTILSTDFLPTLSSPTWTNDTPSGLPGDFALAFLSAQPQILESVSVPYGETPIDLAANNTSYTLQAWVKLPTAPMTARRVILRTAGPAPRVALSVTPDRALLTTVFGVQDFFSSVVIPNDDRWHHVAIVMENFERVHFHLDGVQRQTIEKTDPRVPSATATGDLLIGKESDTLNPFRGLLDRIVIHNTALTTNELDHPAKPGLAIFVTHPSGRLVNPGSNVTFTATVSSPTAATYQWHRRDHLADPTGVPVSGQNTTTLTLNNVTAADEGVYSLVVTNTAGVSESYGAPLTLRPLSTVVSTIDLEAPTYTSGNIGGQDSWVATGGAAGNRVLTATEITNELELIGLTPGETVKSGSQALFFAAPNVASSTLVRVFAGLQSETNVILDVWARGLNQGNTTAPIGNVFFAAEGTAQTTGRAAYLGFRTPSSTLTNIQNIDYGSGDISGGAWNRSGLLFDENEWYLFTAIFDYSAKTYAFYVDNVEVARDITFVHPVSDYFRQLRLFRGANQAGMIVDDITISVPQVVVAPTVGIRSDNGSLIVFWPASVTDFVLKGANAVDAAPETWETVTHAVVGDENQAVIQPTGNSRFFRLSKPLN